ncbi:YgiQ family radical SAM protein [candidate division KSB1 bacterium]|nr:YgiQ family radical SAM protein [candidate division KSB1 bacterium]
MHFLPLNGPETGSKQKQFDIVLLTGDAYVDHPSFGTAVMGRVLESAGYQVGIIAMPDWKNPLSVTAFGKPRLFFGVTSGNVDSMLSRYTAFRKVRNDDPYTPGGQGGLKPERAVIVYCNLIKSVYKDVPIVLGGIEASLRRLVHFDFWSNRLRRCILEDSRADILVYGMGERQILEIAQRLDLGMGLENIPGTVLLMKEQPEDAFLLPSEEQVMSDYESFIQFYRLFYRSFSSKILAQPAVKRHIVHYPPPKDQTSDELDKVYDLPFTRLPHPAYKKPIPAFEMIRFSITAHRGCVSGCAFCSLALHQGRKIISRSEMSILKEVEKIAENENFKGHITDIGGPSANMYGITCSKNWKCGRDSCTFPDLCPNLQIATEIWLKLLDETKNLKNIKNVTIGSGIRYDLLMREKNAGNLLKRLLKDYVSGQLKIAPEHTRPEVLKGMHKTPVYPLEEFVKEVEKTRSAIDKKVYLVPYLLSCYPGCTLANMQDMQNDIQRLFKFLPKQVQAFIPLPMTIASVIYYCGVDPLTGLKYEVEKLPQKRKQQHDVFFSPKIKKDRDKK